MKIWHDDLGLQDDPHEMRVELRVAGWPRAVMATVSGGDVAVAATDRFDWNAYSKFYHTVRLLLLAGF